MFSFFVSFLSCALLTLLVIKTARKHGLGLDGDFGGVQKVHSHAVARIGGIPIFLGSRARLSQLRACRRGYFEEKVSESIKPNAMFQADGPLPRYHLGMVEGWQHRHAMRGP